MTFLLCRVEGTFNGSIFEARLRYTRTWVYRDRGWRILAAHVSPV
ncbi:hypothetical protein ACGFIY_33090 [Micromonospora chersina]